MKKHLLLPVMAIASLMLACNLPTFTAQSAPSQTPLSPTLPSPGIEETQAVTPTETSTPAPTDTPTIAPTSTPSVPTVTTKDKSVNCRFGPGVEYVVVGGMQLGSSATILGKSLDGGWWLIQNPTAPGGNCWVAESVTTAGGNLALLVAVAAPLTSVTKVTIVTDPTTINVPGCVFPATISYKATIEVNGPASVQWHWELSQGNVTSPETLTFTSFGSQTLEDNYHVGAEGDYWVKIVIDSPNSTFAKANYKAVCP